MGGTRLTKEVGIKAYKICEWDTHTHTHTHTRLQKLSLPPRQNVCSLPHSITLSQSPCSRCPKDHLGVFSPGNSIESSLHMTEHTQKSFEIRPGGHTSNEGGRERGDGTRRKERRKEGRRCWNERQGLCSVVKEFLSAAQNMCVPRQESARALPWPGFCPLRANKVRCSLSNESEPFPTESRTHHAALIFDGDC